MPLKEWIAFHVIKWMSIAIPEIIFFGLVARDEKGFRLRLEKLIGGGLQKYKSYSLIALIAIALYTYSTDLTLLLWEFFTGQGMKTAIEALSLFQVSLLGLLTFSVVFSIIMYYGFGKKIEGKHYLFILTPVFLLILFIWAV